MVHSTTRAHEALTLVTEARAGADVTGLPGVLGAGLYGLPLGSPPILGRP